MLIQRNISLKPYNTFGVEATTDYFAEYENIDQLKEILKTEIAQNNPLLHIGSGSNLLFISDFKGLILHSRIKSIEIIEDTKQSVLLRVGSGVVWDDFVAYCVEKGYYGIENLSLIPGEVGAAAVQNIGAYGVEAKDTIQRVETLQINTSGVRIFQNTDCEYGYRKSIFKENLRGQHIITYVVFKLSKIAAYQLEYANLKKSVAKKGDITLANVRQTVIEIRESKLPDPKSLGNAGSFFMNPVISAKQFEELQSKYPTLPHYAAPNGNVKIPAGWLIEQCGLKGKKFNNVAVYEKQALVIVNLGNASGMEIVAVAQKIQDRVFEQFGIIISPEVNYING